MALMLVLVAGCGSAAARLQPSRGSPRPPGVRKTTTPGPSPTPTSTPTPTAIVVRGLGTVQVP
ncbi:MAG: hypothetical protein J2P43_16790, partial [Candidatus Dormibacteraeota bacterium]|nr:hypothetical protein [Candidatus Dormibacteraeota bacterium]